MIRFWARISCPHHTLRCWFYSAVFIGLSVQRGDLEHLRKRVMSQGVTERELRDLNVEFSRQNLKLELYLLHHDVTNVGLNLKRNYLDMMSAIQNKLSSGRLVEEERLDEMLRELDGIR